MALPYLEVPRRQVEARGAAGRSAAAAAAKVGQQAGQDQHFLTCITLGARVQRGGGGRDGCLRSGWHSGLQLYGRGRSRLMHGGKEVAGGVRGGGHGPHSWGLLWCEVWAAAAAQWRVVRSCLCTHLKVADVVMVAPGCSGSLPGYDSYPMIHII